METLRIGFPYFCIFGYQMYHMASLLPGPHPSPVSCFPGFEPLKKRPVKPATPLPGHSLQLFDPRRYTAVRRTECWESRNEIHATPCRRSRWRIESRLSRKRQLSLALFTKNFAHVPSCVVLPCTAGKGCDTIRLPSASLWH